MIDLSTGEVTPPPSTVNDILIDSDILINSNGKIWMQYVVSDSDPDVVDGTRKTMGVTLIASENRGGGGLCFPYDSGCVVGSQAVVGIHQLYMIGKYDLKRYADQEALPDEQQTFTDAYVEAVDGYIVLKFKKFLVKEGGNEIIVDGPQNFIYKFSDTVGEGHGLKGGKSVINISLGGTSKVSDPNQGKILSYGILTGLEWVFLTLLAIGADLLQYLLPPDPAWLNIHKYCNSINFFFSITGFYL